MNPIAIAQYGLIAASNRFAESAQKIAGMGVEGANVDLASEIVDMTLAKTAFSANAAVIKTADEMQGALLNLLTCSRPHRVLTAGPAGPSGRA